MTKRRPAHSSQAAPETIDDYIAGFSAEVRSILEKIRLTVRRAAPQAVEKISYRMPALAQDGILIYFAAFKKHIGIYPPVRGDAYLDRELARYRGEKGNLRFPLDEPMPYGLISRIVKHQLKQQASKAALKRAKKVSRAANRR